MDMDCKGRLSIAVILSLTSACLASSSVDSLVKAHSFYLKGTGTQGPYQLPHDFILSESIKLFNPLAEDLREYDFVFHASNSTLYLSQPLSISDSILVSYHYLHTDLKKRYYKRELEYSSTVDTLNKVVISAKTRPKPVPVKIDENNSSLELKGSKTFSIEAGNSKDLQFKQGLNLSVKGQLTEEVQVLALLSDRGDFYSPTGSTQRLEELDKLRLEISSPNFSGSLGNQQIDYSESRLTGYSKNIKGVQTKAQFSNLSLETTVANSKGTFHSNLIYGQDGKQGPYYLSSPSGQTRISVLPGTEKVWLNGELLQRGSDLDYTIDYLSGAIYFAPARLITSQSVIRVDFEYTQENFSQKFVASRAQLSFQEGALKLGGILISEGDAKNSPLGLPLSELQKQALSLAGDSDTKIQQSGAVYLGPNLGDYLLNYDSTGHAYYQYVGEMKGDYEVDFSYVGENQGEYIYQGAGVFIYAGEAKGNYSPLQSLPVPKSHNLLGLDLAYQPNSSWNVKLELAQSNFDKNTYSRIDDQDNKGWGFDSQVKFSQTDLNLLGKKVRQFQTAAQFFIQDENFSPLSPAQEIESARLWNLPGGLQSKRRFQAEFSPALTIARNFSLSTYLGYFRAGTEFDSRKRSWSLNLPSLNSGSFLLQQENNISLFTPLNDSISARKLQWKKEQFSWTQPLKAWTIRGNYSFERRGQTTLENSWKKYEIGLGSNSVSPLVYEASWSKTNNLSNNNGWQNNISSKTYRFRGALRNWGKALSSNWEYTLNQINYQSEQQSTAQHLALWQIDFSPPQGYLNLDLRYRLNQGGLDLKSHNYVQVPDGKGDYRLENGEYVPDPQGNYQLLIENSGNLRTTLSGEKSLHLAVEPTRLITRKNKSEAKDLLSWLHSDTYLRLDNQVAHNFSLGLDFLLPWQSIQSDTSYMENYNFQQELKITPGFTRHYFVLRWQKESQKSSRYISASQTNQNFRQSQSAYLRLGNANLLELKHEYSLKLQEFSGYPSHRIIGQGYYLTFTHRLSNASQYFCKSRCLAEKDQFQNISSSLYSLAPGFIYSPSATIRWRGSLSWTKVSTGSTYLNWFLAEGKRPGNNFDWDSGLDLRIKDNFQYSASYRGNLLADRSPLHYFRFDLTATF